MNRFQLYLESGPDHRETMVHVIDLPGCVLNGPTTEATLAETPEVIRAFLRLLRRNGEALEADGQFEIDVVEHNTTWDTAGYEFALVTFPSELIDLSQHEIEQRLRWIRHLSGELAAWADRQCSVALDARPADGNWPARVILEHTLESQTGYVERILKTSFDFPDTITAVKRGELSFSPGFQRACDLIADHIATATAEQRANRFTDDDGEIRNLTRALRRTAEHTWEHLLELSRRPGGPNLGMSARLRTKSSLNLAPGIG